MRLLRRTRGGDPDSPTGIRAAVGETLLSRLRCQTRIARTTRLRGLLCLSEDGSHHNPVVSDLAASTSRAEPKRRRGLRIDQLTTMVPTIPAWMVQWYRYVPAVVNFTSQIPPGSSDGSLSEGSLSNVIVCITEPVLVHSITSPT